MITILLITFCFYLVAELIKQGTAAKARKREAARQARIEAEMRRDREERERVAREQREQREALLAHEKALREMHLAQLREEKQRLKLEAEQARQAAVLRKHDEEIEKLKHRIEKAEADILFLQDDIVVLETLRQPKASELHLLMNQKVKDDYNGISNPKRDAQIEKLTKTVRQYDKQIHAGMQKISDMENAKSAAERKMQEVA